MIYFFPMIIACNVALVAVEVALPMLVTAISALVVEIVLMVNCMSSGLVMDPVIPPKAMEGGAVKVVAKLMLMQQVWLPAPSDHDKLAGV